MPGYTVKAILVKIEDVAEVLGSGNDALGLEIMSDKKHNKHFKIVDSKRPFVFVTKQPGEEESVLQKKAPKMETCINQLLRVNAGNPAEDELDERCGYKYTYALEAIALRCGGKYLCNKHWEDFRMGYVGDVQLKAYKNGIDLDLTNGILERGPPPEFLDKKPLPKVVDYPQMGFMSASEMADIVDKLMPDDPDQEEVYEDRDMYTTDVTEEHLAGALSEFQAWIQKSIVQSKDLLFFTYHMP